MLFTCPVFKLEFDFLHLNLKKENRIENSRKNFNFSFVLFIYFAFTRRASRQGSDFDHSKQDKNKN